MQRKVKHTEIYTDSESEQHIVCRGKWILIPCSNDEIKSTGKIVKPIIISETEEIEVDDMFICLDGTNDIYKANNKWISILADESKRSPKTAFKILALTEHLSPEYIKNAKLKYDDEVYINCQIIRELWKGDYKQVWLINNYVKVFKPTQVDVPETFTEEDVENIANAFNNYMNDSFTDEDQYIIETVSQKDYSYLKRLRGCYNGVWHRKPNRD